MILRFYIEIIMTNMKLVKVNCWKEKMIFHR